jgi:hypothetical protein
LLTHRYGDAEQRDQLMAVVDPASSLRYVGTDSVDNNLMMLRTYLPVRVQDFDTFAQDYGAFFLLSPGDGGLFDWWPRRLADEGYALRVEGMRGRQVLYLVEH